MKKNNSYLADDQTDLGDFIKSLWSDKIQILSISIICGLLGYFYALSKPQEFKIVITLKDPPLQIFEAYFLSKQINDQDNSKIFKQFTYDFKLNFLSSSNLESFIEESREFDNFKEYLKSRNISAKNYFENKIGEVNEKNIIIPNKYFLYHPKELDGATFFYKYAEFIKKKTIVELKKNLMLSFLNTLNNHYEALEIAKKIQLENPIIKMPGQPQVVIEPEALFYKGYKVLTENIINLNKKIIVLQNDEFNFNLVLNKSSFSSKTKKNEMNFMLLGILFGFFFSIIIKALLKN